jgi:serine/threonine protein kinase
MSDHPFHAPDYEHLNSLLPQYDIEFFIAQGGMGAVYKGRQLSLERDIAIKVLPPEIGVSEGFRESFISEAKSMAKLNHPNLLGVFDYGTVEGMPYIVMEYVEGGSLHQAAWNKVVEASQAVSIAKGICDGLAHAHEHGIVHRDIKPSNILLTNKLEPKVADFGLAHAADSDKPGLVMGTPGYTAPEVFHDPNQAGPLADVYSVGVILHQLITGVDPTGSTEVPSQLTGRLRLDAIWRKATNPDPAQRYATAAEMSADMGKWIAAQQKSSAAPVTRPSLAPVRPVRPEGGSARSFLVIGALGALVLTAFLVLKERKEEVHTAAADPATSGARIPVAEKPAQPVVPPVTDEKPAQPVVPPVTDEKPIFVPDPEPSRDLEPGDPALRLRAVSLIEEARRKRDKQLSEIDGSSADALAKEQSIDAKCRAELTRIRDAYVKRLNDAAAAAVNDTELKARLLAQAGETKDLDSWIGLLSPEP